MKLVSITFFSWTLVLLVPVICSATKGGPPRRTPGFLPNSVISTITRSKMPRTLPSSIIKSQASLNANKRTNNNVDHFWQRFESVKVAAIAGIAGSVASVPVSFFTDLLIGGSLPQWEFNTDMLALECALFGIVYRYAVREDRTPQLKDGVVGAFSLTRALSMVKVSTTCLPIPLHCGPPLEYLDWHMLGSLGMGLATSFVAFKCASNVIETAFGNGWLSKFPSV